MSTDPAAPPPTDAREPVAAIDVGPDGIGMLVARARAGRLVPLATATAARALGAGLRPGGTLSPGDLDVARVAARRLADEARALGAHRIVVACTAGAAATRNAADLVAALESGGGVPPRRLGAVEEAEITFRGMLAGGARDPLLLLEPREGSLEIMGGERGRLRWSASVPLGVVALTERFSPPDPPAIDIVEPMVAAARELIDPLASGHAAAAAVAGGHVAAELVAIAGAALLDRDALVRAVERLASAPAADVAHESGLDAGRVRHGLAGAAVLEATRRAFGLDALRAGGAALREGLVRDAVAGLGAGG